MKKVTILLMTFAIMLASCDSPKTSSAKKRKKSIKIERYKQHSKAVDNDPTNDMLFWYVIFMNNNSCMYYTSTTPVSDYSSMTLTSAPTMPAQFTGAAKEDMEELDEVDVPVSDMPATVQAEVEADPDSFEGADAEADDAGTATESDNGTDGGSESGGGDSGGSDGGGDGGGGE